VGNPIGKYKGYDGLYADDEAQQVGVLLLIFDTKKGTESFDYNISYPFP
jgi:hypothetical protein